MLLKLILLSGIYLSTNNPDICEQKIKTYDDGERTTAIEVLYQGDCAGQGPYQYYCDEHGVCTDQYIEIKILNEREIAWENLVYGIKGRLKLSSFLK